HKRWGRSRQEELGGSTDEPASFPSRANAPANYEGVCTIRSKQTVLAHVHLRPKRTSAQVSSLTGHFAMRRLPPYVGGGRAGITHDGLARRNYRILPVRSQPQIVRLFSRERSVL